MQNIFIVGSKGIPGAYGGYETFVDKLTQYHCEDQNLAYHVSCKSNINNEFVYNNARCFNVRTPNIGPAQAIFYDVMSLIQCCNYIKKNNIESPIVYILACRIGPFSKYFYKRVKRLGGRIFINPDGHEWLRAKWNFLIRKYWKLSEQLMVKNSDLIICDSKNIELYIKKTYKRYRPNTTYIAYGAETIESKEIKDKGKFNDWINIHNLASRGYYLIVGRFVPENNYEIIIKEFMISKTDKKLVVITNIDDKYYEKLRISTNFDLDDRIRFVGTVYDQDLLSLIRENAFGYIHGHEVGGTNPSLLEALGCTSINMLLDVGFNKEVAEEGAIYWNKKSGSLSKIIEYSESMEVEKVEELRRAARNRIIGEYNWKLISNKYKNVFLEMNND